jgi:DNA-nicking Smr family endonuclease
MVASTVQLAPGRAAPILESDPKVAAEAAEPPAKPDHLQHTIGRPKVPAGYQAPQSIEPRRHHRIARGRDQIGARIDLHGMTQDQARAALTTFLFNAQDEGVRAVLVITGKGVSGEGVLRRRFPEWLAEPELRKIVAGLSTAERHHGGEGAFYVALKRKTR